MAAVAEVSSGERLGREQRGLGLLSGRKRMMVGNLYRAWGSWRRGRIGDHGPEISGIPAAVERALVRRCVQRKKKRRGPPVSEREREGRGSGRPGDSGSGTTLADWAGKARWAGERGRGPLGFGPFFYLFLNRDKKKNKSQIHKNII